LAKKANGIKKINKTNKFQKILRSSKNDNSTILNRTLTELSSQDLRTSLDLIYRHQAFSQLFLSKRADFSKFYSYIPVRNKEMILPWVESIITKSASKLNEFINLEKIITKHILCAEYNLALELVEQVEIKYGKSLWGYQAKLTIISKVEEPEIVKNYYNENFNNNDTNLIKFVQNNIFSRMDENSLYFQTNDEQERKLEEAFSDDVMFVSFLKYKALPFENQKNIDTIGILYYELNTSIIDLYKAYISCLSIELFQTVNINDNWKGSCKRIAQKIKSKTIANLSLAMGNKEVIYENASVKDLMYIDSYTAGDYLQTVKLYNSENEYLSDFSAFDILCKSCSRIDYSPETNNFKFDTELLTQVVKLYSSSNNIENILAKTFNEAFKFNNLDWFIHFSLFLISNFIKLKKEEKASIDKLYYLKSSFISAIKCSYLEHDISQDLLSHLFSIAKDSKSLNLYTLYSDAKNNNVDKLYNLKIDSTRLKKYIAAHLYNRNEYELALEHYKSMFETGSIFTKKESITGYIETLIELNKLTEAAELVCDLYINKGFTNYDYSIELLCKKLKENIRVTISIFTPICFHIYSKFYGDDYFTAQKVSFEMFVMKENAVNFKSIITNGKYLDSKIPEYFLENIFVPPIMKGPILFTNADQIENLRLSICQFLVENNLGHKEELLLEIKRRSKAIVLKDAKIHVENTKIYVDIDYVKNKVEKESKTLFDKYISLYDERFDEDEQQLVELISKLSKPNSVSSGLEDVHTYNIFRMLHITNIDLTTKGKTFISLLKIIRDEFTNGIKGLSGYLSTSIRHGTLETHLRKSFTENKLIKKIPAGNTKYFLTANIDNANKPQLNKIDTLLDVFSESFDKIIGEVLDEWLQVTLLDLDLSTLKETNKSALFNYSISNVLAFEIQSRVEKHYTFENFWELAMDWLWITTDQNLIDVQKKFESNLLPNLKKALENLEKGLAAIHTSNTIDLTEILSAVAKTRQNITVNVNEASRWFTRNVHKAQESYDFEIVLDIVEKSISMKKPVVIIENVTIPGQLLSHYVDIMHILYANAIKHSKIDKDDVDILCEVTQNEKELIISVTNSCQRVHETTQLNQKLSKYNDIYSTETSLDKLQQEGGTGFYKIQKLIKEDIGSNYICDITYSSNDQFNVKVQIL
jgi:hypothetical protein